MATSTITLHVIPWQRLIVRVIGTSPLLTKRFSEQAKARIRAKQEHAPWPSRKAEARDPLAEMEESIYRAPRSGQPGVPALHFEVACRRAARYVLDRRVTGPRVKAGLRLDGGILVIEGPPPKLHEAPVRLATGVQDFTYRPLYWPWAVRLQVRFRADLFSAEQMVNLIQQAGECVGVGEGRPMPKQSDSNLGFGTFRVDPQGVVQG